VVRQILDECGRKLAGINESIADIRTRFVESIHTAREMSEELANHLEEMQAKWEERWRKAHGTAHRKLEEVAAIAGNDVDGAIAKLRELRDDVAKYRCALGVGVPNQGVMKAIATNPGFRGLVGTAIEYIRSWPPGKKGIEVELTRLLAAKLEHIANTQSQLRLSIERQEPIRTRHRIRTTRAKATGEEPSEVQVEFGVISEGIRREQARYPADSLMRQAYGTVHTEMLKLRDMGNTTVMAIRALTPNPQTVQERINYRVYREAIAQAYYPDWDVRRKHDSSATEARSKLTLLLAQYLTVGQWKLEGIGRELAQATDNLRRVLEGGE
jgi:hypothetical protein